MEGCSKHKTLKHKVAYLEQQYKQKMGCMLCLLEGILDKNIHLFNNLFGKLMSESVLHNTSLQHTFQNHIDKLMDEREDQILNPIQQMLNDERILLNTLVQKLLDSLDSIQHQNDFQQFFQSIDQLIQTDTSVHKQQEIKSNIDSFQKIKQSNMKLEGLIESLKQNDKTLADEIMQVTKKQMARQKKLFDVIRVQNKSVEEKIEMMDNPYCITFNVTNVETLFALQAEVKNTKQYKINLNISNCHNNQFLKIADMVDQTGFSDKVVHLCYNQWHDSNNQTILLDDISIRFPNVYSICVHDKNHQFDENLHQKQIESIKKISLFNFAININNNFQKEQVIETLKQYNDQLKMQKHLKGLYYGSKYIQINEATSAEQVKEYIECVDNL